MGNNTNQLAPLTAPLKPLYAPLKPLGPTNGLAPDLDPQIAKDLAIWMEDMAILAEMREKLKQFAAAIKNHGNVMFEIMQVFALFQNIESGKILTNADLSKINTDIRNTLNAGQSDWNSMINTYHGRQKAAEALVNEIKQIEDFIKYESGVKNPVFDKASLNNLQKAIDSIKAAFTYKGKDGKTVDAWGDPKAMSDLMHKWLVKESQDGTAVPQLSDIQGAFQTLNQSVSEFATTVNARLQFVENEYKQALGMYSSVVKNVTTILRSIVQNSRSN